MASRAGAKKPGPAVGQKRKKPDDDKPTRMGLSDALGADYGDFEVAPRSAALPEDVGVEDFVDEDAGSGSASAAAFGDAGDGHGGKVKDKSKKSKSSSKSTRAGAGGGEEDDDDGGSEKEGGDGGVGLRKRLLELLESHPRGVGSRALARRLEVPPEALGKVMVGLIAEGRVDPMKTRNADGAEVQVFVAVKPERAEKLRGLGEEDKAVLAIVERSGGTGVWVRTIKNQTKVQQAALLKILKRLEGRKLIKPITSIAFKHRKMFMGYDIEPSKDITGGVWYNEAELDLDLISKIKRGAVSAVAAHGNVATPAQVCRTLQEKGASTVPLSAMDVAQVLDSLVYEGWLDYEGAGPWRVKTLAKPERMEFPRRGLLIDEKLPKKKRAAAGAGASYGDYTSDFASAASSSSSGAAGAGAGEEEEEEADEEGTGGAPGSVLDRRYMIVRRKADTPAAGADYLTSVPCGSCPVSKSCKPGGLVSPETCVYMSHWLQW